MTRNDGNDLAVIYISAYTAQIEGRLYLLPYDVDARSDTAIMTTGVRLQI
jgi:hypothetical protein